MARIQTILIADPDPDFLDWTTHQLSSPSTRILTTSDSEEAYRLFMREKPDVLMAETHLSPIGGMELMARIRQRDSNAVVVLTSAFGTTQAVIESMRLGAFDFVRKETLPFNLRAVIDAALKAQAEMKAATSAKPQLTVEEHQDSLVGKSEAMAQVFKMVGRVSLSDAPVMITGESGSGKEFVAINCAAIPEQLLESELFGHEKGSFTGAVTQRVGRFEQSNGGTLFLDEIGDMPIQLQSKILRVLQDGEFTRVGGTATLKSDVRIVAATNKNLEQEVAEKKFREDLFYRLNVVRIHLPPLRQRLEDIRLLAEYFLQRVAIRLHLPKLKISEDAMKVLEGYSWPGNVRELENTIQRACVLCTSDVLLPKDIPLDGGISAESPQTSNPSLAGVVTKEMAIDALFKVAEADPSLQLLPWLEREFTLHSMRMTNGNQVRSAKLLGITRATLRKRLEIFGITRELNIS
jgi:two-component system nitrogen regulation response regulator GlnG